MRLLLPVLTFVGLAAALPSPSESSVWTRVDTSKPSSTSPIVWSRVDTTKPSPSPSSSSSSASTSPLVWSRVDTSKPSPTSPSSASSSSPLVWSRVTTTTTTTATPVWTKVVTTRTPSSTVSSSQSTTTTSSSSSSAPSSTAKCPINWRTDGGLPQCYQGQNLTWTKTPTFLNYQPPRSGFYNTSLATNGTGYYSGVACENVKYDSKWPVLRVAVSDELAKLHGGLDKLCGKKLLISDAGEGRFSTRGPPSPAIVTRSCSTEFCPGESFGLGDGNGETWFVPPDDRFRFGIIRAFYMSFRGEPDKIHKVAFNHYEWFNWDGQKDWYAV